MRKLRILVTFTEDILGGKLHILYSANNELYWIKQQGKDRPKGKTHQKRKRYLNNLRRQ